jgi:hypothetical protein
LKLKVMKMFTMACAGEEGLRSWVISGLDIHHMSTIVIILAGCSGTHLYHCSGGRGRRKASSRPALTKLARYCLKNKINPKGLGTIEPSNLQIQSLVLFIILAEYTVWTIDSYRLSLYLWSRDRQANWHTHTGQGEVHKFSGSIMLRKCKTVYEIESGVREQLSTEKVEEVNEMSLKRHFS